MKSNELVVIIGTLIQQMVVRVLQSQVLGYRDEYQGIVPSSTKLCLIERIHGYFDIVVSTALEVCERYRGYTGEYTGIRT
jgi:hypothetical protein